jgi:hypothetical protein
MGRQWRITSRRALERIPVVVGPERREQDDETKRSDGQTRSTPAQRITSVEDLLGAAG